MPQYPLNASQEQMDRWKAVAKERGQTLAKFLRDAADAAADPAQVPYDTAVGQGPNGPPVVNEAFALLPIRDQSYAGAPPIVKPDWKR